MSTNESVSNLTPITKPQGHPAAQSERIGVCLINLGTPDATDYWSMRKYLSEFLSDTRVINLPKILWQPILQGIILSIRPSKSGKAYQSIWNNEQNESPLKTITRAQCEKVSTMLGAELNNVEVTWAMRYGNPSIKSGIDELTAKGCKKILLFALYPQYSATTTATAFDKAFDHLKTLRWQPAIRTSSPWHDRDEYITALANKVKAHLSTLDFEPEYVLTSFHGLPKKYLMKGDPYHCMCVKNSRLLQEKLGWPEDKWLTTFQSRFGPAEWLKPYTEPTLVELAEKGIKNIAILSPAFVSDCIETLEEIAIEGKNTFLEHGGENFSYIPCLNDDAEHVDMLCTYIKQELQGWI
ncbi:MAG: ferrochelatase [Pseudomonadota bacterium]|jgi:ferrochelatase|nr:ferrochelatase [Pseudomonadota bacterium]